MDVISPGIKRIINECSNLKVLPKCDNRLTGSQVIDENLHDIISYLIRDYIYLWYDKVSDNEEFYYHVKNTGQKVIVQVAARFVPTLNPYRSRSSFFFTTLYLYSFEIFFFFEKYQIRFEFCFRNNE